MPPVTQPEHALIKALDLIKEKILAVSSLVGLVDEIKEAFGGHIVLNQEGVFISGVEETYEYGTRGIQEFPTNSAARITLAFQFARQSLNQVRDDKPVSALLMISGDVRRKIEAESAAGTWRDFTPPGATAPSGMEVMYVSQTPMFADELDLGVMEVVLEVRGYHE